MIEHRWSDRRTWVVTFLLLTVVYASTAHWYGINNLDATATAWPAWNLVHQGSLFFSDAADLPDTPWFSLVGDRYVSDRMPGAVLIGVPAQAVLAGLDLSPSTPAVLSAVLVTAAAMANVLVLLRRATGDLRLAAAAVTVLALGTGFLTNASAELWTHGPDALWLSLALLALQNNRMWLAGLALAPAMWTRPHLSLVAAALGLALASARRSPKPLLALGLPTGAALAALTGWNTWVFGQPSVGGGYTGREAAITAVTASATTNMLKSAAGSLVSPLHGLFVFTPIALLMVVCAYVGVRRAPAWAVGALLGGLLYQIAQWRLNSFTGGGGQYGYRLPLELLLLATPVALLGFVELRRRLRGVSEVARLLSGLSVGIHLVGVYWYQPLGPLGQELDPWTTWMPWEAAQMRGPVGALLAGAVVLCATGLAVLRLDSLRDLRQRLNGTTRAARDAVPEREPILI